MQAQVRPSEAAGAAAGSLLSAATAGGLLSLRAAAEAEGVPPTVRSRARPSCSRRARRDVEAEVHGPMPVLASTGLDNDTNRTQTARYNTLTKH